MRQELWQINSFMLSLLVLTLAISLLLKKTPPVMSRRGIAMPAEMPLMLSREEVQNIYVSDLFDTYSPIQEKREELIAAIPTPGALEEITAPKKETVKITPPLKIKLKGILFSSNTSKSVALIEDEAGKEQSYVLGEKVKDAQVVKIAQDKIVMIRDSGQQEIMFLKKPDDEKIVGKAQIKWDNTVKKVEDDLYEVDPTRFPVMVDSLAQLIEELDLITAYKKGIPLGLEVGKLAEKTVGKMIGLEEKDLIVAINDTKTANLKDRYKAFSTIMDSKMDDEVKISIKRNQQDLTITYKLASLPLEKEPPFEKLKAHKAGLFSLNRDQKREDNVRKFQEHNPEERMKMLEDIRKKLLENIERRERNMRIR